jgi:hypothetical protein
MADRKMRRRTLMKLLGALTFGRFGLSASSTDLSASETTHTMDEIAYPGHVPDRASIFRQIEEICSWGIRRPGYPADKRAEQYVADAFKSFGMQNVRLEPVPSKKWEPSEYSLTVKTRDRQFEIDCFPLPYTTLDVNLELDLALFDEDSPGDVKGKASLHTLELMTMPATLPVLGGPELEEMNRVSRLTVRPDGIVVDPGGSLKETRQIVPFTKEIHGVMEPSQAAGALAFIGVLGGHPGDICEYYVPYGGRKQPFPCVWIKESDGRKLQSLLADGPVRVNLVVKATVEPATDHNVVGELPGPTDDVLLIGSHHDGPWASAVEDASGVALVLAQAEYWSKVPEEQRPHQMHFLLQAGHMAGSPGARAYVTKHNEMLKRVVLEVHLEHAAAEVQKGEKGLELTGQPETRWFFTSRNADLQRSVKNALLREGIDRSLILAPDTFAEAPTTDAGIYHMRGVPLVNYLTAPFYLFDSLDTPDKIHQESLDSITRATIRILQDTQGVSASQMREGISES